MTNDPSINEDTAENIREDVEQADDDVTTRMRWTAGAKLAVLFGSMAGALALAVQLGYIQPAVTVEATLDIGWVVEYLVAGLAGLFLLYVATLIVIWLPGSVLSLLGGLAYGAAQAAGYIED